MKAYHFCAIDSEGDAILRDGNIVEPGATEIFKDPVFICKSGLHASRHVFDALRYAPGPILRLVECSDIVEEQNDKFVCRKRVELARINASRLLQEFACDCAERALPIFEKEYPNDKRPRQTIKVTRRYARGEATEEELAAARALAWNTAEYAAGASAMDAAWYAASYAAKAAWNAAGASARAAAWYAAGDAAWYAAGEVAKDAAGDAAGDAAKDAENKWQRSILARRANIALKKI